MVFIYEKQRNLCDIQMLFVRRGIRTYNAKCHKNIVGRLEGEDKLNDFFEFVNSVGTVFHGFPNSRDNVF